MIISLSLQMCGCSCLFVWLRPAFRKWYRWPKYPDAVCAQIGRHNQLIDMYRLTYPKTVLFVLFWRFHKMGQKRLKLFVLYRPVGETWHLKCLVAFKNSPDAHGLPNEFLMRRHGSEFVDERTGGLGCLDFFRYRCKRVQILIFI